MVLYRDPSIQIITTLGPEACKHYLHWAIWIPEDFIIHSMDYSRLGYGRGPLLVGNTIILSCLQVLKKTEEQGSCISPFVKK